MAASSRRAVLTGIGVLTPISQDTPSYWRSLLEGRSGVRSVGVFDSAGLPVRIAGEITHFDPKNYIPKEPKERRKSLRVMARTIQLAVCAAHLALDDGAVNTEQ